MEEKPPQRGFSNEAWVAVGGISAALITGVVTLLIHVIPAAQNPSVPAPATALITASPTPGVVAPAADAIAGDWEGMAQNGNATFQVTLGIIEP